MVRRTGRSVFLALVNTILSLRRSGTLNSFSINEVELTEIEYDIGQHARVPTPVSVL